MGRWLIHNLHTAWGPLCRECPSGVFGAEQADDPGRTSSERLGRYWSPRGLRRCGGRRNGRGQEKELLKVYNRICIVTSFKNALGWRQ